MEIQRSGLCGVGQGAGGLVHRTVRIDPLFSAPDPARLTGGHDTFEPGARRRGAPIRSARS